MNDVADPSGGATTTVWLVPVEPAFDFVVGTAHGYERPKGEVTPDYAEPACGMSSFVNDESATRATADDVHKCPRCVRVLRGQAC